MKLLCPNPQCAHTVSLRDRACPNCGISLALKPVLNSYGRNLKISVSTIQCPDCGQAATWTARACPNPSCRAPLTVDSVANAAMKAPRDRWQRFLDNATATTAIRIQRAYLLASAALLWGLLSLAENQWTDHWLLYAVLAVSYFLMLGFLAPLIAPNVDFQTVWNCATNRVKLGIICNWLSLLLLMQLLVGVWCARAVMLASLIVMGCLAIWILCGGFSSAQNQETEFDPSEPQGRRARFE